MHFFVDKDDEIVYRESTTTHTIYYKNGKIIYETAEFLDPKFDDENWIFYPLTWNKIYSKKVRDGLADRPDVQFLHRGWETLNLIIGFDGNDIYGFLLDYYNLKPKPV